MRVSLAKLYVCLRHEKGSRSWCINKINIVNLIKVLSALRSSRNPKSAKDKDHLIPDQVIRASVYGL